MKIGETYLKEYRQMLGQISARVNNYLENNKLTGHIQPSFYLQFLSNKDKYYTKHAIYQKNKERILYVPTLELKYIQKYILHTVLEQSIQQYKLSPSVTGFIKNQSILTNTTPHLNRVAIIKFDIKDFFPSISRYMVYSIFRKYNHFDYKYSYILSHLVTYQDQLPQGAPTSPFLANICANGIDYKILKYLSKINKTHQMDIRYTRYADDLTISFDRKFNYDYIIGVVIDIILSEGFYPNLKKIKVLKKHQSQKVTGIILNNEFPTIEKKERERIKFILNIWKKYGIDDAIRVWNKNQLGTQISHTSVNENSAIQSKINPLHVKFKEIMLGKINYFNMINSEHNVKIEKLFNSLFEQ